MLKNYTNTVVSNETCEVNLIHFDKVNEKGQDKKGGNDDK